MDTLELIARSQQGDKTARNQVISENVGLIWSIVRRFLGRGQEAEDLFQIGSIGLMKAVDKFEQSYEVKFSTYAVPMITGEIKRFLRDDGLIKVSRSLKETAGRVRRAHDTLEAANGREPTITEIGNLLDLAEEEIVMALESGAEVESIDRQVYQGDGTAIYLMDKLTKNEDESTQLVDHIALSECLSKMNEQQQRLIQMRYFEEKTQTEIAAVLGMSQVQVSRMEKKILQRMRDEILR